MRLHRFGAVLALGLEGSLGACSSAPQAPPGWSGPFDVTTVIEQATRAGGGPRAVALPDRVRTRSRIVLHAPTGTQVGGELIYWAEGAARERRELITDDHHRVVQIIDGERSLELEDGRPTDRDLVLEARARRRYRSLLSDLAAAEPTTVALVSEPEADPSRVIVVERRAGATERWQLWLDARTLLPIRIRCITEAGDGVHVDEDLLSAHERFGARVVPCHQVTRRDGRRLKEAWLLDYDEDPTLDAALFALSPIGRDE